MIKKLSIVEFWMAHQGPTYLMAQTTLTEELRVLQQRDPHVDSGDWTHTLKVEWTSLLTKSTLFDNAIAIEWYDLKSMFFFFIWPMKWEIYRIIII